MYVGAGVGERVGDAVGSNVGEALGEVVGDDVGATVGDIVGPAVGEAVIGDAVGEAVGADVGEIVDSNQNRTSRTPVITLKKIVARLQFTSGSTNIAGAIPLEDAGCDAGMPTLPLGHCREIFNRVSTPDSEEKALYAILLTRMTPSNCKVSHSSR